MVSGGNALVIEDNMAFTSVDMLRARQRAAQNQKKNRVDWTIFSCRQFFDFVGLFVDVCRVVRGITRGHAHALELTVAQWLFMTGSCIL